MSFVCRSTLRSISGAAVKRNSGVWSALCECPTLPSQNTHVITVSSRVLSWTWNRRLIILTILKCLPCLWLWRKHNCRRNFLLRLLGSFKSSAYCHINLLVKFFFFVFVVALNILKCSYCFLWLCIILQKAFRFTLFVHSDIYIYIYRGGPR